VTGSPAGKSLQKFASELMGEMAGRSQSSSTPDAHRYLGSRS